MINIKYSFLMMIILGMISCQTTPEVAKVTADISDPEIRELVFSNPVDIRYDTLSNLNGGALELETNKDGEVVSFLIGRSRNYLFIEPGTEIKLSKKQGEELVIQSSNQADQDLLKDFDKEMSIANSKYNMREMADTTADIFLMELDQKYEKVNGLLTEYESKGGSTSLLSMLKGRVAADRANSINSYSDYYKYLTKREAEVPDGFYDAATDFDLNDEKPYYFNEVKYAALGMVGKDINYEDYDNTDEYYRAQYDAVNEKVKNKKIAEILSFNILSDKVNYDGGAGSLQPEVDEFIATSADASRDAELMAAVRKWAHLQKGMQAPDFQAYTRDGEEVNLSDLKGKNVYIDVWATWCGPCIAEIPSLKKMEEKYHGENVEFVSVSIDAQKDKEKWKRMVAEKELGGTQVMAENDWRSEVAQEYNIMGIPRFIMIDSKGSIVNAQAPRPSNAGSFDKMLAEVLN